MVWGASEILLLQKEEAKEGVGEGTKSFGGVLTREL